MSPNERPFLIHSYTKSTVHEVPAMWEGSPIRLQTYTDLILLSVPMSHKAIETQVKIRPLSELSQDKMTSLVIMLFSFHSTVFLIKNYLAIQHKNFEKIYFY